MGENLVMHMLVVNIILILISYLSLTASICYQQIGHCDVNLQEEISVLQKKIKQIQKKLNYQRVYNLKQDSSLDPVSATNENSPAITYTVTRNILPENCILSITGKVSTDNNKTTLPNTIAAGAINLYRPLLSFTTSFFKKKSNYGFLLGYERINLYYQTAKERDRDLKHIKELNQLCMKKKQLEELLTPPAPTSSSENSSSSSLSNDGPSNKNHEALHLKTYNKVGDRPVHYDPNNLNISSNEKETLQVAPLAGPESFLTRYQLISQAKKSIYLQTIHFVGDEAGIELTELLIRKKQEQKDIDIRIIVDSLLAFVEHKDLVARKNTVAIYNNLMAAGIPVLGYQCGALRHQIGAELKEAFKMAILYLREKLGAFIQRFFNDRRHEKILTIDGKFAVMGGMNIADQYFDIYPPGKNYWQDQDMLIIINYLASSPNVNIDNSIDNNSIIKDIENIFEGMFQTYINIFGDHHQKCFNPYPVGTVEYKNFLKTHIKKYSDVTLNMAVKELANEENNPQLLTEHFKRYKHKDVATWLKKWWIKNENIQTKKHIYKTIRNLKAGKIGDSFFNPHFYNASEYQAIQQRPRLHELSIEQAYLDLINQAKNEILIANPYFIPSAEIKNALKAANARGVKVKIITNGEKTIDNRLVKVLARYYYKDLLDPSVGSKNELEIYEWDGTDKQTGKQLRGLLHAKFMLVDQSAGIIGSYNLDNLSRNIQSESAIAIVSKGMISKLAEEFYTVDLKYAQRVTYEQALQYRKIRGFGLRQLGQKILLFLAQKLSKIL